jgi:hypothetical protein
MINMLPSILLPLLPLAWGVAAISLWGRNLASPVLYGSAVTLSGFGIQLIARFFLDKWKIPAGGNIIAVSRLSPEDVGAMLERQNQDAWQLAGVVLVVSIAFAFWLRSGFFLRT